MMHTMITPPDRRADLARDMIADAAKLVGLLPPVVTTLPPNCLRGSPTGVAQIHKNMI
jgi:hypothetical protein